MAHLKCRLTKDAKCSISPVRAEVLANAVLKENGEARHRAHGKAEVKAKPSKRKMGMLAIGHAGKLK